MNVPAYGTASTMCITHIGGPTALIEVGPWRLLTDPTFDAPGRRYPFALGTSSRKLSGPAIAARDVGDIDAVLLSHDQHADNLDDAGRALLPKAGVVVTTASGAHRLRRSANARGLAPWQTTRLEKPGAAPLEITATPCRHGPPIGHLISGDVIGFSLAWEGQQHGAVWISGDTVLYAGVREVARRLQIGTAILHLGSVQFPLTGPLRYTLNAREAAELCESIRPRTVIPLHYEGWSHFQEGRLAIESEVANARNAEALRRAWQWITPGVPTEFTV